MHQKAFPRTSTIPEYTARKLGPVEPTRLETDRASRIGTAVCFFHGLFGREVHSKAIVFPFVSFGVGNCLGFGGSCRIFSKTIVACLY